MSDSIRIGIIGFDTSHVVAFSRILNDRNYEFHIPGCKVVAGFKGGSPDIKSSAERVDGFTKTLTEDYGVEVYDSIEKLTENVDAVLLESVDGRPHLEQARPVIASKKPLFIDKPLTAGTADAQEIQKLAEAAGVEIFSGSSLRWDINIAAEAATDAGGAVLGCDASGPCSLEATNPGMYWYGVHGVEILYTFMGPGCKSVSCTVQADAEVTTGVWSDGRIGTMRGIRKGKAGYSARVFREEKIVDVYSSPLVPAYAQLMKQVVKFFRTGKSPVPLAETVEMMAFMEAAIKSSEQDGKSVGL